MYLIHLTLTCVLMIVAIVLIILALSNNEVVYCGTIATNIGCAQIPWVKQKQTIQVASNVVSVAYMPDALVMLHEDDTVTCLDTNTKQVSNKHSLQQHGEDGFIAEYKSQNVFLQRTQTKLCVSKGSSAVIKSNTNVFLQQHDTKSLLFQVPIGSSAGVYFDAKHLECVIVSGTTASFFTLAMHTNPGK
jgi:hypothetical protein